MPLCGSARSCGCALTSSTLTLNGDGTGLSPWVLDIPAGANQLIRPTFATTAERDTLLPAPAEGQICYVRADDTDYYWKGSAPWIVWNRKRTALSTGEATFTPSPSPAGFAHNNATATGFYSVSAGRVSMDVDYKIGSSTTWGAANFTPIYSFVTACPPTATISGLRHGVGAAWFLDNTPTPSQMYSGKTEVSSGGLRIYSAAGGSFLIGNGTNVPFVWSANDEFEASWEYDQL